MKEYIGNIVSFARFSQSWSLVQLSAILLICFSLIAAQFMILIEWPNDFTIIKKVIFLKKIVQDFFIASSFILLFYSKHGWIRFISYLLACLCFLVYFIQVKSFEITGSFLPSIALENAHHIGFLNLGEIFYALAIWSFIFAAIILYEHKFIKTFPSLLPRTLMVFMLIIIVVLVNNDKKWLSKKTIDQRFAFYNSGQFPQGSPLFEIWYTASDFLIYLRQQNWASSLPKNEEISAETARFIYRHYRQWGRVSEEYPLVKEHIYNSPLPFKMLEKETGHKDNLIIFFVEGMSARIIQPYSDLFPNLSPNLKDFAKSAMQVDNYYNHTFATYRGLGGSLCSLYPVGLLLKKSDYYCMPHVLRDEGYDTQFFFSQRKDKTYLDELFKKVGFDRVESYETLSPLLNYVLDDNILTDRELIDVLIQKLKILEKSEGSNPFFVGVYNFQTHTGIRIDDKDSVYMLPNGEESFALDSFHNFDKVFGVFWNYFVQSSLFKNTVVVVTSDHATFPSRDYVKLTNYGIWADTIPLLIYHPNVDLPQVYNANHVSSVNLTPSLLHLLGVKNRPNPFLGTSIFDKTDKNLSVMVGANKEFWYLDSSNQWALIDKDSVSSHIISQGIDQFNFISYSHQLERANKIWNYLKTTPKREGL